MHTTYVGTESIDKRLCTVAIWVVQKQVTTFMTSAGFLRYRGSKCDVYCLCLECRPSPQILSVMQGAAQWIVTQNAQALVYLCRSVHWKSQQGQSMWKRWWLAETHQRRWSSSLQHVEETTLVTDQPLTMSTIGWAASHDVAHQETRVWYDC